MAPIDIKPGVRMLSTKEWAELRGYSRYHAHHLASTGQLKGAQEIAGRWSIPEDTEYTPADQSSPSARRGNVPADYLTLGEYAKSKSMKYSTANAHASAGKIPGAIKYVVDEAKGTTRWIVPRPGTKAAKAAGLQ